MLRLDIPGVVTSKQTIQKKYHDRHVRMRTFTPGQTVMARDYLSSKKWVPGVIVHYFTRSSSATRESSFDIQIRFKMACPLTQQSHKVSLMTVSSSSTVTPVQLPRPAVCQKSKEAAVVSLADALNVIDVQWSV